MAVKNTKAKVEEKQQEAVPAAPASALDESAVVATPATDEIPTVDETPTTGETPTVDETVNADTPSEEEDKVLVAQVYILYLAHHYKPGEEIPASDLDMVNAWLEAGSVQWVPISEFARDKAYPMTAIDGMYGTATCSDSDDGINIVGRVPINSARQRK
jgi:hypothetical protein